MEPKEWNPMRTAPTDEFVLVVIKSGMVGPLYDVVYAINRLESNGWRDVQNYLLADRYGDVEPIGWLPRECLPEPIVPLQELDEKLSDAVRVLERVYVQGTELDNDEFVAVKGIITQHHELKNAVRHLFESTSNQQSFASNSPQQIERYRNAVEDVKGFL